MKRHALLLAFAVSITFTAAQTSASTPSPTLSSAKTPEQAIQTPPPKSSLADAPAPGPANPNHLFTVNDEKGLLLTCIAPEIDTNTDTDVFKGCTLAPGRTLDDVMHSFIQGIHYEQSQHQKERDEWRKNLDELTAQKPAQKQ
jgi:hypothetical protein